jgi:hypothetical protein
MPAHYALSDAAIALVAAWATFALWRQRQILQGFAMACFGVAAAIGVVRFGAGLQTELAALHAGSSQTLGLAAVLTLASTGVWRTGDRPATALIAAILGISLATYVFAHMLLAPLFVLALTLALIAAIVQAVRFGGSWLIPSGLLLLLADTLLIRRAPWLAEAAAWHAYHLLIALALMMLAKAMLRAYRRLAVV